MAHRIEGTTIYMPRGDTVTIKVRIMQVNDDGTTEEYIPTETDHIIFSCRHAALKDGGTAYVDSEPIIEKTIPNATQVLALDTNDTIGLGFGRYNYSVTLQGAQGRRTILRGDLILEKETLGQWLQ